MSTLHHSASRRDAGDSASETHFRLDDTPLLVGALPDTRSGYSVPSDVPNVRLDAKTLVARIQRDPDDIEAIRALRWHYVETRDNGSLANLMEGWSQRLRNPDRAGDALVEAGDAAHALGDALRAQAHYEKALKRAPWHRAALQRLIPMLEGAQQQARLLQWIHHLLGALGADPTRHGARLAELHYLAGTLYERHFERLDTAVEHYRCALQYEPGLVHATVRAREIYRRAGNLRAAAVLYEFQIKSTEAVDDRVALLVELAQLWAEQLVDLDPAIAALRRAVELRPNDLELLDTLATYLLSRARSEEGPKALADQRRAAALLYTAATRSSSLDAQRYIQAALECHPEHAGALALQAALRTAATRADAEASVVRHRDAASNTRPLSATPPPIPSSALPPIPTAVRRAKPPPPPPSLRPAPPRADATLQFDLSFPRPPRIPSDAE